MQIEIAYIMAEMIDPDAPAKFPGATRAELAGIARRILENPENAWQRSLQKGAHRCAAIAFDRD